MNKVLREIEVEVNGALSKLPEGYEDKNTQNDYIAYATAYLGRAAHGVFRNEREELDSRDFLVKAAGILVSAIVAYDKR